MTNKVNLFFLPGFDVIGYKRGFIRLFSTEKENPLTVVGKPWPSGLGSSVTLKNKVCPSVFDIDAVEIYAIIPVFW